MATEEFGTVTFGKGGEVIPVGGENDSYEFPDEIEAKEEKKTRGKPEVEIEVNASDVDIEIVDDTPPEDKGRAPMETAPEDIDEDELNEYDKKVQRRIKKFSKGYHDERRAKEEAIKMREEALRVAQFMAEENKRLQSQLHEGSKVLIQQGKYGAETELNMAKKAYKEAYDMGDSDALVEAQMKIAEATLKLDKVQNMRPVEIKEDQYQVPKSQPEAPAQDPKLTKWLDENPWYGGETPEEDEMTGLAITVHNRLAREFGEKYVGTDDYYEKINATMQKRFPDHFQEQDETQEVEAKQPVKTRATKPAAAVVAPATRSVAPKKVQLTPTQVQIAKRLGVPLELYAKKVAEQMENR
jgi:hypothetical protein